MNALRNLFSTRTLTTLRQHGQNVLYNFAQPVDAASATTTTVGTGADDAAAAAKVVGAEQRNGQTLKIPKSILEATNFKSNVKFGNTIASGSISPTTLKRLRRMERKVQLVYRCKLCNTRNDKLVSEAAYNSGVVILQCDGCEVNHLITDHVGWFANAKGKNFDQVLAERKHCVKIIKVNQHGEVIY